MSLTRFNSFLAGTALAGAALFGAAGSAQAATYAGSWDPMFGPPFPNLYWSADGTFEVPDSCLALGNGTYDNSTVCGGLTVTSMTISFYDGTGGVKGALLASLPSTLATPSLLQSVIVSDNQLVGLNTSFFSGVVPSGVSQAGNGTSDMYGFALYLTYNPDGPPPGQYAQLEYYSPSNTATGCPNPSNNLLGKCGFSAFARGTFTPMVPEPSTYMLLAAGLAVVGFIGKRRRS